jgi:hypothetical protein
VLSVLRFTDSDYCPFGIVKLFSYDLINHKEYNSDKGHIFIWPIKERQSKFWGIKILALADSCYPIDQYIYRCAIVLSVLRFTDSDYCPFGIVKLFSYDLINHKEYNSDKYAIMKPYDNTRDWNTSPVL